MPTSSPPQRKGIPGSLTLVLVLLAISVFINYVDRGNLSIAAPLLKGELGISASQLGVLLSAFFWTYALLQLFSGWLVDRLNVNWVFAGGFFLWSAATAATGIVHTFSVLFLLLMIHGMGESVAYPSYSKIIALHFPEEHRGLANAVIAAGLALGPGFGMLLGGLLMARFGWRRFSLCSVLSACCGSFPGSGGCPRNATRFTWTRRAHRVFLSFCACDPLGEPASGSFALITSAISSLRGFLFISCASGTSPWTTRRRSAGSLTCWGPVSPRWRVGFLIAGSCRGRLPRASVRPLRVEGSHLRGFSLGSLSSAGRSIALPRSYWA